jgi:hypothetical protein
MHACHLQNATQKSQKVFVHVPSEIAAHEVEEIGKVFHLILHELQKIVSFFRNSQKEFVHVDLPIMRMLR